MKMSELKDDTRKVSYSKNVRMTSKPTDLDSEALVDAMRFNKINHLNYNPTLVNNEWRRHFKEVISKNNLNGGPPVNFN
jgi:hypothetical protein